MRFSAGLKRGCVFEPTGHGLIGERECRAKERKGGFEPRIRSLSVNAKSFYWFN